MIKSVNIAGIDIANRYFLAPMAGITDSAFRSVCKSFGAGLTYSEMVSAKALTFRDKKSLSLLEAGDDELPLIVQIFGSEPEVCAEGALIAIENSKAAAIDINMGCPVPKIVLNHEGSALMKDIKRAEQVITAVKRAIDLPLTVKFRRGFTFDDLNAVEFAKMAESAGVSAVCVHGRTRTQMYSGQSDMQTIADVKNAVSVPVIASGDIFSPEDAFKAMDEYGADAVMAARGSLGNPFIFREFLQYEETGSYEKPSYDEIFDTMKNHIALAAERKGERRAVAECRKHMLWYLKGIRGSKKHKTVLTSLDDYREVIAYLDEIKNDCRQV